TLHGVSQKVTTTGVMEIAGGKPTISGTFKVKIKDYGITGLYIGEKIANEAEISVNCKYE
ncbi:MAG: YceI family protein, partial [Mucilaginibacter sp.]